MANATAIALLKLGNSFQGRLASTIPDHNPMWPQELLGHSTIAITLDTYSHVLPGMGDSLADTMDEAFG